MKRVTNFTLKSTKNHLYYVRDESRYKNLLLSGSFVENGPSP